jgi:hypothetical protein
MICLGYLLGGQSGTQSFKVDADLEQLANLFARKTTNHRTTIGCDIDETVRGETLKCFPYGAATDSELLHEVVRDKSLARYDAAGENCIAQTLDNIVNGLAASLSKFRCHNFSASHDR